MSRGIIRKPSFNKIVGAYRSQWKRFWMRLFTFGIYGSKGIGWWKNPKKAWYNFWYYRTSVSIYRILGCKPSRGASFLGFFVASIISIFAAPVEATRAGVKARKIKKERKAREEGRTTRATTAHKTTTSTTTPKTRTDSATYSSASSKSYTSKTSSSNGASTSKTHSSPSSYKRTSTATNPKPSTPRYTSTTIITTIAPNKVEEKPKETYNYSFTSLFPKEEKAVPVVSKVEEPKEPDENTPKSKSKHEGDQYIRKRMFIAGSSYCDKTVLDALTVGTYFDLEAEPDNPYDKDAVKLTYNGQKIGYIAKQDHLAFVTCLKLKRNIYGVITAIKADEHPVKYEFETWFDLSR
jgi:hypothetical protein